MLRSIPKFDYSGLTIVLSNPSRFDKADLLTANGGYFLNEMCLRPDINRYQCDVRISEDKSPLLPKTKCVLLLGDRATKDKLGNLAGENTLGALRGSPFVIDDVPHIASYFPQDCVDFKDHESEHNPLSEHYRDSTNLDYVDEDDEDSESEKRRHGVTQRKNFGFWLLQDCKKAKYILEHGLPTHEEPEYVIYPKLEDVINILTTHKNEYFYFDCETDSEFNITVFAFSFDSKCIYVVPCLLPDYSWAYSGLPAIYKALYICIQNNCIVAHNGSNFDFFVLAYKYHIGIGRKVWDTLIAQHRCFPEIEKSLGHCISMWTWLRFHKDMGDVPYNNLVNAQQVWQYCGLDVYSMALVREAQEIYAKKRPGLTESIQQGNDAVRPYLITQLMGMHYKPEMVQQTMNENDRLLTQYIRMLKFLVGEETLKTIRGKGKSFMPSSNPQCCRYFHELLGYPIVGKGNEKQDGSRGASLGKKNLYKLRLKQENPVIDVCLAFRELTKESGTLKFTPWKL